jgi:hypothetical protein
MCCNFRWVPPLLEIIYGSTSYQCHSRPYFFWGLLEFSCLEFVANHGVYSASSSPGIDIGSTTSYSSLLLETGNRSPNYRYRAGASLMASERGGGGG